QDGPLGEHLRPRAEIAEQFVATSGQPPRGLRVGPGATPRSGATCFVVPCGAGDDPPVLEADLPRYRQQESGVSCERFSTFVFAAAWRQRTARYFWSSQNHWAGGVTARDPAFGPMELDFLKDHFAEGLLDGTDPSGPTWYFFSADAWVRIRRAGDLRGRGTGFWSLCAASRERLAGVVRPVWPWGGARQGAVLPHAPREGVLRVWGPEESGGSS